MNVPEAKRQIADFDKTYEDEITELSDIERLLEAAKYMVIAYDFLQVAYDNNQRLLMRNDDGFGWERR